MSKKSGGLASCSTAWHMAILVALVGGLFATILIQFVFTIMKEASWKDACIIGGVIFLCICGTGIIVAEQNGLLY